MTTPAERAFAEGVAAWTPPWAKAGELESLTPAADQELESLTQAADQEAEPKVTGDIKDNSRPEPQEEVDVETSEPVELRPALEAILLVVDEPVAELVLAQVLEQPTALITDTLVDLAAEYAAQRRGFELRRVAGGWRLYTRGEFASYVEKFVLDGQQTKLTQAALETLAVVAYKQPVTRSRISAIRGVNCDGVLRTLLTRGLIEECGSEPDFGAHLYRTTVLFCEKLGINSADELSSLAPYLPDDIDALADAHDQS